MIWSRWEMCAGDLAYLAASNGTMICVGSVPLMRYNSPADRDWWGIAQGIAPGSLVGLGGRRSASGFHPVVEGL
jgi:hypothetical protein